MGKQCIEAKAVFCTIVCKHETTFKMEVYGDKLLSGGNLKWHLEELGATSALVIFFSVPCGEPAHNDKKLSKQSGELHCLNSSDGILSASCTHRIT